MKYLSFEKSVGGVVYRVENGKILYLLLQYRSWQWDFPKGHVEENESEEETLRREIKEETGLEHLSIVPNFRTLVRYFYVAKGNEKKERLRENRGIYIFKKVPYYAVKTEESTVTIDFESKAFAWLPFKEALQRIKNSGSTKILTTVHQMLENGKKG